MITLNQIEKHFENEINKMCNAGNNWENWYPKYSSCNNVAFVSDVFAWIEFSDALNEPNFGEITDSWERVQCDYDGNISEALFHAYQTVKKIYDEHFTIELPEIVEKAKSLIVAVNSNVEGMWEGDLEEEVDCVKLQYISEECEELENALKSVEKLNSKDS